VVQPENLAKLDFEFCSCEKVAWLVIEDFVSCVDMDCCTVGIGCVLSVPCTRRSY
jgi:hypothetical protein